MAAELQLGDESKLHMSNPFERRNLKTLLPKSAEQDIVGQDEYRDVPLAAINGQSGMQVRAAFDIDHDDEDRALVESLTSDGQRVPVLLAQTASGDSPQYTPLDGHRRIAALRHIGRSHVKAVVVRAATLEYDLISLTANVRKHLTPLEMAEALARLESEHSLKPDDVARRVGLTRSYVWRLRRLVKAPPAIREAVQANRISAHVAVALLKAPEEHQQAALELADSYQLSEPQVVRVLEESAKRKLTPDQAAQALLLISAPVNPSASELAPSLPASPEKRQSVGDGLGEATREAIVKYALEMFPEVTEEQAGGVAELVIDQPQPHKLAKAACLLILSNWEPIRAAEGAELSTHDPQVRRVVAMLDLCLELEGMLRSGTYSRECAPMLVGLMRRLLATKRLALKLEKE